MNAICRARGLPMIVLCIVGTVAGGVLAATADSMAPAPAIAPAKVWAGACSYCHDEGVAPPIFGLGLAPAALAAVIRSGLNGMPAFHPSELTDAQLQALAEWIAQQPAGTAPASTAPAGTAPAKR